MEAHQAIWDARYERVRREERTIPGEPWLDPWLDRVPAGTRRRALDVGCGSGHNARLLLDRNFDVTAFDFSRNALELCRREAPGARVALIDVRSGLPFERGAFHLVVADLSLHYFPWAVTTEAVRAVRGIEKRFFSEDCVRRLMAGPWRVVALDEKTTLRFGAPKVMWELLASRVAR